MCLILLALNAYPDFPFVLVGNRDEFFERPTERFHQWEHASQIYAGRDKKAGGTWMGINTFGEFAAVTNFREVPLEVNKPRSRGDLPLSFLSNPGIKAMEYFVELEHIREEYAPYNLLAGNFRELYYVSNRSSDIIQLHDGYHGLSNHLLNTPWPKVEKGKDKLRQCLTERNPDIRDLLGLMEDSHVASDEDLPDTGIGKAHEKALSSMFISMGNYGTCLTTALMLDRKGALHIAERSHYPREKGEKDRMMRIQNIPLF